jgi:hypothetical protein
MHVSLMKSVLKMVKFFGLLFFLFYSTISNGQTTRASCSEHYEKNEDGPDSIIIKKCFIKHFKIISTGYPDYKGRYTFEEELYLKKNNKFIKISNSEMFKSNQSELLLTINNKIQEDFLNFRTDPNSKDCFEGIDSIPKYSLNDLNISFEGNNIWFEVTFGLNSACRAVDGTIVSFPIDQISKYLN